MAAAPAPQTQPHPQRRHHHHGTGHQAHHNEELQLGLPVQGPNLVNDCIWVQSADGSIMQSVTKEFLTMVPWSNKQMINGLGASKHHPAILPRQITPETLQIISSYVEFHSAPGRSDKERKQYDERLVKMGTKRLCELTSAADSLEMRPLVDMTSRGLARLIEGKSPEEIREAFNLPDDLTEEEKLEPVKNLINDPRIRLLNRLYAKKRKELHSKKIEAKKISDEQVKLQDSRPLDELLSFIEANPGGKQEQSVDSHSKDGKAKKSKQNKAKQKGGDSKDGQGHSSNNCRNSVAAAAAATACKGAQEEEHEEQDAADDVAGMEEGQLLGVLSALEAQLAELEQVPQSPAPATSQKQQKKQQRQQQQQQPQGHKPEAPPSRRSGIKQPPPSNSSSIDQQQQQLLQQPHHQVLLPPPCTSCKSPLQQNGSILPDLFSPPPQLPHSFPHDQQQEQQGLLQRSHISGGLHQQYTEGRLSCPSLSATTATSLQGEAPAGFKHPGTAPQWEARVHELLFSKSGCIRSSRLPALPVLEDPDDEESLGGDGSGLRQ